MTLVFHAVVSRALPSVSHTSAVSHCVAKEDSLRRTQIRVAIWWCSEYVGLYGYQSNGFATSDNRSTIMLIRSFYHQLSAESDLLSHRCEQSIPASVPSFIFRSLFIPLSLQIGTRSSILFLAIPIRDLVYLLQVDLD